MSSFNFKHIIIFFALLMSFSVYSAQVIFSKKQCLDMTFETEVTHRGHPFGLTETKLLVKKNGCVLDIAHESMRFVKKAWEIDVCRAPVHIKSGAGAVTVLRREGPCAEGAQSRFCIEAKNINDILQNDGLIFAQGERENLATSHGQIHCAFTLLQDYLYEGKVLSRHGMIEEEMKPRRRPREREKREKFEGKIEIEEQFPESEEPGKF